MSNDDDTVPATASEVAATLKDGDIDALVELAKTLQEKTGCGGADLPPSAIDESNSAIGELFALDCRWVLAYLPSGERRS